jgi:uncharacterized protein
VRFLAQIAAAFRLYTTSVSRGKSMNRTVSFWTLLFAMLPFGCENNPTKPIAASTTASTPAPATDHGKVAMSDAYSAYQSGDDARALAIFLPFARSGSREAQVRVAHIYSRDKGVAPNTTESCNWWEAAAQQGDAVGANNVGRCYETGNGRGKSNSNAAIWYRRAADGGNAYGMYNLGLAYEYGRGVAQSFATAADWFRRALAAKLAAADNVDAERHLKRSMNHVNAVKGDPIAQYDLAIALFNGHYPETKDERRAIAMMREAATRGSSPEAWYTYGSWVSGGLGGVKSELAQAATWIKKASDAGHESARIRYANMLLCGIGVKKDMNGAERLLRATIDSGSWLAMSEFSEWHNRGDCGFKKNAALGKEWRAKADVAQRAEATRRTSK